VSEKGLSEGVSKTPCGSNKIEEGEEHLPRRKAKIEVEEVPPS
jgi:hypothetical protein